MFYSLSLLLCVHKEFFKFRIFFEMVSELADLKRPILSYNFKLDKNLLTKPVQIRTSLSESSSSNISMALLTWAMSDLFIESPELWTVGIFIILFTNVSSIVIEFVRKSSILSLLLYGSD